ncbi:biopolymer transporter Tol [Herbiconiux liangxiaofengii]|uniref:biopolymer transporter Tol n=1 Tax=Herbiconiux liangxiaofengii TaxID=3342795 RepID=UPI0035BB2EB1
MSRDEPAGERVYTDDERWIVIGGRRWRRTDPVLPVETVEALQGHLGRARASVGAAKRTGDGERMAAARVRVGLAKRGLGERGPKWWEIAEPERLAQAREALAELDREPDSPPDE